MKTAAEAYTNGGQIPVLETRFLRGIKSVHIGATDGKVQFAVADRYIPHVDRKFGGADVEPTDDTSAGLYSVTNEGTPTDFFASLGGNINSLIFTESQIVLFAVWEGAVLMPEGSSEILLLLKEKDGVCVASIFRYPDGKLCVQRYPISTIKTWAAGSRVLARMPKI